MSDISISIDCSTPVTTTSSSLTQKKSIPVIKPYVSKYKCTSTVNVRSPVKREQLRKAAKADLKKKMRESLPVYTMGEIRRYRMPLHKAIAAELEEKQLINSATFLKQLIDFQEWMRQSSGPESKVWSKPQIIETPEILMDISEALQKAETAHYMHDFAAEIDEFLYLGVKYGFNSVDWWWLGEQLLMQCNELAKQYEGDGHRRRAISGYIYGKFLFENVLDREQAFTHLSHARKLSVGHSWTAAKYLNCVQKTVFVECCTVLYKVLLEDAKEMMKYDARGAITLCLKAKRYAYDACAHDGEAKALLLAGHCHMLIDQVSEAEKCFFKVLLMQTKAKDVKAICEARIWLIRAYLKLGHWEESYNQLQKHLQFALENNLPYYVGQAYRYLGEYYLNNGNPNLATPLLLKAIEAFHKIGNVNNREQVKNFAAVSAGQELMPKYIKYIVMSGQNSPVSWKYLQRLINWKDIRKRTWVESDTSISALTSYDDMFDSSTEKSYLQNYMLEEEIVDEEDLQLSEMERKMWGIDLSTSTAGLSASSGFVSKRPIIKSSVIKLSTPKSESTVLMSASKSVTINLDVV